MKKQMKSGPFGLNYVYDYEKIIKTDSENATKKQVENLCKTNLKETKSFTKKQIKRLKNK